MPRRRLRAALAAAVAAPLLIGPVGADAASGPLTCPAATKAGLFQRLPIEAFRGVPSVQTRDVVTGYALDEKRPERVLATNGNTIKLSTSHGCAWDDVLVLEASASGSVPLSGVTSTIVAVAYLPNGPALAAVREGTGAASRPHVVRSGSGSGGWAESSSGLPLQGSPRLLEPASDGRTAYLSLSPTTDASGGNGGTLPTVPGVGSPTGGPAGLLYATTDGGASWELRTTAGALPSGASGFDALAVDVSDPNLLYGVAGGRFVVSRDGGRSLEVDPQLSGVTAVEPMDPGEVSILVGSGQLLWSTDAGRTYVGKPAPPGATSAAHRPGSSSVMVEAGGRLHDVQARGKQGRVRALDTGVASTAGSARGDRAPGGSFHALAGHSLLRYVDPLPPKTPPPPVVGDALPPPPKPGRFAPGRTSVRLPVGSSQVVPLELRLPRNPTPTDVYLLLDISPSMEEELNQLKKDFGAFLGSVQDAGISLRVGFATVGSGPRQGEAPYPDTVPGNEKYRKPQIYQQRRALGPIDAQLSAAVAATTLQTCPPNRCGDSQEGQLLALQQALRGDGIEMEQSSALVPVYAVRPGQAAGFRNVKGVRSVAVLASDDAFEAPHPTPTRPDGEVAADFIATVAKELKAADVSFLGLAATSVGGGSAAGPDMRRLAGLVGTKAPEGGVDCGQGVLVPAGAPLVCDGSSDVTAVLTRLIKSLADRQSVSLTGRGATEVLGFLDGRGLKNLDVTAPNAVSVPVRVSCVDVGAGTRTAQVDASLRGFRVATATLDVTCTPVAKAAATPPRPDPAPVQEAPPAQPAQAPAVPAPAPPVVQAQAQAQVQSQVQSQVQVQPLTAAALQQQEELQLALALLADERPSPGNELAMVDRRRGEELRALALLALSMSGASALGVARLRSRRAEQVRVVRSR